MPAEISAASAVLPTAATGYAQPTEKTASAASSGFASMLGGAVDDVQGLQSSSKQLTTEAITGEGADLHTATLASARASLALETIATFRNRGVEAFNEIMRMQA